MSETIEQVLARAVSRALSRGDEIEWGGEAYEVDLTDPTTGDGTIKVEAGGPMNECGQAAIYFTLRVEQAEVIR